MTQPRNNACERENDADWQVKHEQCALFVEKAKQYLHAYASWSRVLSSNDSSRRVSGRRTQLSSELVCDTCECKNELQSIQAKSREIGAKTQNCANRACVTPRKERAGKKSLRWGGEGAEQGERTCSDQRATFKKNGTS